MKKTLIKGLTVLTLIVCLITTLVGCNNDNSNSGSNNTPAETLNTLAHPFLVDAANRADAENFFKALKTPYENKKGDLLLKNSSSVTVSNPAVGTEGFVPKIEYDETKSIYVDLDVQAIVNIDNNNNMDLKEVYTYFNGRGKKNAADSTDAYVGNIYFKNTNKDTDSVLISIKQGPKTLFEKKILIGNINDYIAKSKELGTPDFTNILKELDTKVPLLSTLLGTSVENLMDQQVGMLLTRMLFKHNADKTNLIPLYKDDNGHCTLDINTDNFNEAVNAFFIRSANVIKDTNYNPLKDYNTDKKDDDLKNDSDNAIISIDKIISPSGFSFDNLAKHFKVQNDTVTNPVELKLSFDKTENGIENGTFKFTAAKGTYLTLPSATGEATKTNTLASDISIAVNNITVTATPVEVNANINTNNFANKATVDTLTAENLLTFNIKGDVNGQYFEEVKNSDESKSEQVVNLNREYTLKASINPFALASIHSKINATQAEKIFNKAINNFELVITDPTSTDTDKTVYSVKYNPSVGFEINYKGGSETFTFEKMTKMVKVLRGVITFKDGESILSKINFDSKTGIVKKITEILSGELTLPTFETNLDDKISALIIPNGFDKELLNIFNLSYQRVIGKDPAFIDHIYGLNSGVTQVRVTILEKKFFA